MNNNIKVGSKTVNSESSVFIIAELSANHGHDISIAKQTINEAKEAGADAIKLQTFTPNTITIDCNNDYFTLKQGIWEGRNLYSLYKEAFLPWEWHKELMDYARDLNIISFSTPFDKSAVDFLESLNVPAYKVASFEITDIPLIEYIASKGKPVIISTGIATLSEIDEAVRTCRKVGNNQIILLKCTSSYPAKIEDANLLSIKSLRETFGVDVGISDHTLGVTTSIVSVALGAKVIEKHFIIDKSIGGPDASFSLDKHEFKNLVNSVREAEMSLGRREYELTEVNKKSRTFSRSLFVVKDMKKGEIFNENNVRSIRPGYGLAPKYINSVIGRRAKHNIIKGTPLVWEIID